MSNNGRSFEEEKLPEKLNFGVWLKIGKYALKRWPLLLFLVLMMVLTTFYDSAFAPLMNKAVLDAAENMLSISEGATSVFDLNLLLNVFGAKISISYTNYIILFGIMVIVRSLSIFATFFLTNYIGMLIMIDLRRDSFNKIQRLSFSYFDKTSSGWLIARMQNDTSAIGDTLSWGIISIFWSIFDIIFSIISMFTIDWRLALVVIASLPLVAIIVPIFENAVLKAHRTARNAYSHYVGWLAESIDGAKTIKTLAIEDRVNKEAGEITEDIRKKRLHAGKINAFFSPILMLISSIVTSIVVAIGLQNPESAKGGWMISISILILFISYVSYIYDPLRTVSEAFSEFMASQAGAEKLMQLLEAPVAIEDNPEVLEKYGDIINPKVENYEKISGDLEFSHVDFDYGNGIKVIDDLNIKIQKGTSLAIVGETGSGKTTTVNLLCRFYEPTSGQILIDGVDYKKRSLGWLHSSIGYVQQNPFVFTGTYRANILYGRQDASEEEMINACKMVGIHDFIMRQEKGYDTYLEDGGGNLSQGQKQLISFARAIVRNPALLILDEATSSLDSETEAELQEAVNVLLKGRTTIVIAHRLSTIVSCDRIILMDKGKIVEDGNHKSLMEKKGAYYSLYMNQFKDLSIDGQIREYQENIEGKNINLD